MDINFSGHELDEICDPTGEGEGGGRHLPSFPCFALSRGKGGGGGRGGGVAFSVSPFSLPFFSSLFFFSFSRPAFASLETGNGNMNFK